MAFIVEDGTGLPNATSYASVAEFDAYWTDRGDTDLVALSTPVKEVALILGTDWTDLKFRWRGTKKEADPGILEQALEWPREGVTDIHTLAILDEDSVPVQIKNGTIEAAAVATSADIFPNVLKATAEILSESKGARGLTISRGFRQVFNSSPVLRKAIAWYERLRAGEEFCRA